MLGKLMKYDMKYMSRILPWLYLAALVTAVLCAGFIMIAHETVILSFAIVLLPSLCTFTTEAVVVLTVVFMIMRIYRSMFSDEGYLTFTLPVKCGSIVDSKILTGAVWSFFAIVTAVLSIILPSFAAGVRNGSTGLADFLKVMLSAAYDTFASSPVLSVILVTVILLDTASLSFIVPSLYTLCCTATHKARKARAFASIGMFMGILYALSVLTVIVLIFVMISAEVNEATSLYMNPFYSTDAPYYDLMFAIRPLAVLFVMTAPVTVISWTVSKRIVNKKLNML